MKDAVLWNSDVSPLALQVWSGIFIWWKLVIGRCRQHGRRHQLSQLLWLTCPLLLQNLLLYYHAFDIVSSVLVFPEFYWSEDVWQFFFTWLLIGLHGVSNWHNFNTAMSPGAVRSQGRGESENSQVLEQAEHTAFAGWIYHLPLGMGTPKWCQ